MNCEERQQYLILGEPSIYGSATNLYVVGKYEVLKLEARGRVR